jgi:hypothetical protein
MRLKELLVALAAVSIGDAPGACGRLNTQQVTGPARGASGGDRNGHEVSSHELKKDLTRRGGKAPFDSTMVSVLFIAVFAMAGGFTGFLLYLADTNRRRVAAWERVNPILRAYFAMGAGSIVLWFPTVLFGVFVLILFGLLLMVH